MERQGHEPEFLTGLGPASIWAYREKVVSLESTDPEICFRRETGVLKKTNRAFLLIKHYVLRRERHYERVRREVDALENLEKLDSASRFPNQSVFMSGSAFKQWKRAAGRLSSSVPWVNSMRPPRSIQKNGGVFVLNPGDLTQQLNGVSRKRFLTRITFDRLKDPDALYLGAPRLRAGKIH
jgi:hypothetical protein